MKTMDHVKKRIIISMVSILLLIITLFGITYAYFTSKVKGNDKESISVKSGKLALEYGDGNGVITAEKIIPGTELDTKTFTVKNTGTHIVESYEVIVENITNTLINYQDLTYSLTCKSFKSLDYEENGTKATETGTCNGSSGIFPKTEDYLVRNSIEKDITHYYEIVVTYNETNEDQSIDMKKKVEGKINILDDEINYKSVLVYGNSIQDGTPSPTSPIEIESVGNLSNLWYAEQEYTFTGNGTASSLIWKPVENITFKENTQYTLSFDVITENIKYSESGNLIFFSVKYTDGTYSYFGVTTSNMNEERVVFTTNSGKSVASIEGINRHNRWTSGTITISNINLEEGKTNGDYVPVGKYNIPINVKSKNVLNYIGTSRTIDGVTFTHNSDGSLTMNGTNTGTSNITYAINGATSLSWSLSLEANKTYMLSHKSSLPKGIYLQVTYQDGDSTSLYKTSPAEFTTKTNVKAAVYIRFDVGVTANNITIYPQIEEGTIATSYEPYVEPQTYNIILNEPLRKVGDCDTCADYIDLYKGEIIRNVGNLIKDGSNVSLYTTTNTYNQFIFAKNTYLPNVKTYGNVISSYMEQSNKETAQLNNVYVGYENFNLCIDTSYTQEKIQELLNATPMQIHYELASSSQPEKLNINIPKINKNSIITIGTEVQPSKIETEY